MQPLGIFPYSMLPKLSFCYGDLKQSQAITTLEAIPAGVNVDVVIEW